MKSKKMEKMKKVHSEEEICLINKDRVIFALKMYIEMGNKGPWKCDPEIRMGYLMCLQDLGLIEEE